MSTSNKSGIRKYKPLKHLLLLSFFIPKVIFCQYDFEVEPSLYGGFEHNIFKSPERLFDRNQEIYLEKDSLLTSDIFFDLGYDMAFKLRIDSNSTLGIDQSALLRNYTEYSNGNQSEVDLEINFEHIVKKKLILGGTYGLAHKNTIGTSVLGDELTRSFIYLENKIMPAIKYIYNPKNEFELEYKIQYKGYYADESDEPLNHLNSKVELEYIHRPSTDMYISATFGYANRTYSFYHSVDSTGYADSTYPLRNFKYLDYQCELYTKVYNNFRFIPYIDLTQRIDVFEDYYSYFTTKVGARIRYFHPKVYATAAASFKQTDYKIRKAPTFLDEDPSLTYKYLEYEAKVKYYVTNHFDIIAELAIESRNSNTELEYYSTRRPYTYFEILLGVCYEFERDKPGNLYNLRLVQNE